jgi:sulfate transport system substrate-binding protein
LVGWENEALMAIDELGKDNVELVVPKQSILAEPPVAVVDTYANKHGTKPVAQAYLDFLYTPEGQEIIAKRHYRPRLESAVTKYASQFPKLELFTIEEVFGGWQKAHAKHFADGAIFDQIYQPWQK